MLIEHSDIISIEEIAQEYNLRSGTLRQWLDRNTHGFRDVALYSRRFDRPIFTVPRVAEFFENNPKARRATSGDD